MPTATQEARLARLEAATATRAHAGVVLYRDRADVPGLLAEAQRAGRVAEGFGLLVIPEPLPRDEWLVAAREHYDSIR